ncbi:MAG: hypothetical protein KGK44_06105 [Gammaproteobacteria bacterium]|nr:hypothetical protein [Gammaproteobacteria bacterium]
MSGTFAERMEKAQTELMAHILAVRDANIVEIDAHSERECRRIITNARERARNLLQTAVGEERREREHLQRSSRGAAEQAVRSLQHQLMRETIDAAYIRLKDSLLKLWTDPKAQSTWLQLSLGAAAARLDEGVWQLQHPRNWQPAAHAVVLQAFTGQHPGVHLEPQECRELACGFRIASNGVRIDSSLTGLESDVEGIKGRLLGVLATLPGWVRDNREDADGG